jgi:LCP family protein required for cell wall assembly
VEGRYGSARLPAVSSAAKGTAGPSSFVGVFLSFLWPGLGQWYLGRRRRGLLYAAPVIAAVAVVLAQLVGGLETFVAELITPSFALTVFILLALLGIWRLIAMADALVGSHSARARRTRAAGPLFVVLALVVVGVHVWAGSMTLAFYDAGRRIFVGEGGPDAAPQAFDPSASIDPDDNALDFEATPFATPQTASARINVLVTGIDSGHGRNHALTDTLMLVSVDPDTKRVAILSFPRDISDFPLAGGGTYRGKINSLMTYARLHPDEFPDGGLPSLAKEIGHLAGVPVHYFASIDLDGFRTLLDLVGGVDVDNPRAIDDPRYDWFDGTHGFQLAAGGVHLDGRLGLAYVRSRQGIGDNDFTRARRQQQVLSALRKKLTDPSMVTKLPQILEAASSMVRTNIPASRVSDLMPLAGQIEDEAIQRVVLGPPYARNPPSGTGGTYKLLFDMDRLANLSIELFGDDSRYSGS